MSTSETFDDGGPAFPVAESVRQNPEDSADIVIVPGSPGLSLLDWFAGQALAGLCAGSPGIDYANAARYSYQHAIDMLNERERILSGAAK